MVVPTWNRPELLANCLAGLGRQIRPPEQIVLAIRGREDEYRRAIAEWQAKSGFAGDLRVEEVTRPGGTFAYNRGLALATGDVVCFTDDDAVPRPEWLDRILERYRQPDVGAVGGWDALEWTRDGPRAEQVGIVTWYGKIISNNHLGASDCREVDHLKGVNMSFRRALLRPFDEQLLGDVVYFEVDACLQIRAQDYRVLWDPAVIVDHFPAAREHGIPREADRALKVFQNSFNAAYVVLKHVSAPRAAAFLLFAFAVGSTGEPGLALHLRGRVPGARPEPHLRAAFAGRWSAMRAAWGHRRRGGPTPSLQ